MKTVACLLLAAVLFVLSPSGTHGQQAAAPVYKDGDWWRVKVDRKLAPGVSISGLCKSEYPEYLVKIDNGRRKVFGVEGDRLEAIRCPFIILEVLGKSKSRKNLKFPLHVGLSWSDRFSFKLVGSGRSWVYPQYEVRSWEKITTLKGKFDAFKLVMVLSARVDRVTTYFYAPKVKAIVYSQETAGDYERTSTLVDFNVSD